MSTKSWMTTVTVPHKHLKGSRLDRAVTIGALEAYLDKQAGNKDRQNPYRSIAWAGAWDDGYDAYMADEITVEESRSEECGEG